MTYLVAQKKHLLLLLFSGMSLSLYAQEKRVFNNMIGISPFQSLLLKNIRIKYEHSSSENWNYGGLLTAYSGLLSSTSGIQLAPFVRYYYKAKAPEGIYYQMKFSGGIYSRDVGTYTYTYNPYGRLDEIRTQTFTSFGLGMAAGYQFLWGKNKRWTADLNLGLKLAGGIPALKLKKEEYITENYDGLEWYLIGPGSLVDGIISIGYRL